MNTSDERKSILHMIESGKVSAEEGAQLLAAVGAPTATGGPPAAGRWLRIRVTELGSDRPTVNVNIPAGLLSLAARIGGRYVQTSSGIDLNDVFQQVQSGAVGRLLDVEDHRDGTRVEIFVE